MIPVRTVFDGVTKDDVNSVENGNMGGDRFNRLSKRAELKVLDYLTGDVEGIIPPVMFSTGKLNDWLSQFIELKTVNVVNGYAKKPEGFYKIVSLSAITGDTQEDENECDNNINEHIDICRNPIDLLTEDEFNFRCVTSIKGLKPTFLNPIAKRTDTGFAFAPKDIGFVEISCVRYPKFAEIKFKEDPLYKTMEIDEEESTNYEYGEWATEMLIYFITQLWAKHTREDALAQHNNLVGKSVRDNVRAS